MLTYDMDKRISASEALQEPWIVKYTKEKKVTEKDLLLSLNNLKNFRTQLMLQTAVLSYIASQQLSKPEEAKIRALFDSFDKDKDGQLTKKELVDVLKYMHGDSKKIHKEADQIFRNIDLNNNGTIEYNGILAYLLSECDGFIEFLVANLEIKSVLDEETLRNAFEFYDAVFLLSILNLNQATNE